MGFRANSFATIWEVEPVSDTRTKCRLSVSRKNKQSGDYETEFSGIVYFVGTAAAKKALQLKRLDKIRLGDIDVTTNYNEEKKIWYTNYKIFSFSTQAEVDGSAQQTNQPNPKLPVDDGEADEPRLPF